MKWDQRPNGDLELSVLMGFAIATGEGGRVGARLEYARVEEQMSGDIAPEAVQLVMTGDAAEALGLELIAAANRARGAASN